MNKHEQMIDMVNFIVSELENLAYADFDMVKDYLSELEAYQNEMWKDEIEDLKMRLISCR